MKQVKKESKTPRITVILIAALLLTTTQQLKAEDLCNKALQSCEAEIDIRIKVEEEQDKFIKTLKEQRDDAVSKIQSNSLVPFYVWLVVGAAGGVILTRGLR